MSPSPSRRGKTPRTRRNIIIGASLFLAAAMALGWAISRSAALPLSRLTGGLLIGGLSLLNALLILALLVIILREGAKLLLERQAGRGRLKTRLLLVIVGLALAPAIVIPLVGYSLVQQSISRWFDASAGSVSRQSEALVSAGYSHFRERTGRQTELMLTELAVPAVTPRSVPRPHAKVQPPGDCTARLAKLRPVESYGLDYFAVVFSDGLWCEQIVGPAATNAQNSAPAPAPAPVLASPPQPDELRKIPLGAAAALDRPDGGQWIAAKRSLALPLSLAGGEAAGFGAVHLDASLAAQARAISEAGGAWREEQSRKKSVKAIVLSVFLIVTLGVILFVTWIASQFARAITGPLERLAEGTARVASGGGETEVVVEGAGAGEIGTLIAAFNRMAAELRAERMNRDAQAGALQAARSTAETQRGLLQELLNHLDAGVLLIDGSGALALFNPAAERIHGGPLSPLLGHSPAAASNQDEASAAPEAPFPWSELLAAPADGRPARLAAPSGDEVRHLEIRAAPLADGQRLFLLEDVTDLVRAERLAAWQEVAQKLAHEIKNPLTPIQLAAERLLLKGESAPEPLGGIIVESTRAIREEVIALKRLVDEFSRFARLPTPEAKAGPLLPLVESLAGLYGGGGAPPEISAPEAAINALFDAEALRRILINLLDNARAAAGAQGKIWIALGRRGKFALIEVSDNGPGITPEVRGKIFSPFFTTKKGGTGLGLAIAARSAKEMGGTLRADARPGGGAKFTVTLPLAE